MPPAPRWSGPAPYDLTEPPAEGGAEPIRLPDPLTLRDAMLLALQANKDVLVTDLGAQADREAIMSAEGEFDPVSFAEIRRGRTNLPIAGEFLDVTDIDQSEGEGRAGVRQRMITGTDVEFSASTDYTRDLNDTDGINPVHEPQLRVGVSQDLLRYAGVSVNRTFVSLAENTYQSSIEQLRATAMDTLLEVEAAYWDLFFALEDLRVRRDRLENAERLVSVAQAQVDVGISPPLDVTRAQSSAARQQINILDARNRVDRLRHRLLRALGIIEANAVNVEFALADSPTADTREFEFARAIQTALRHRPDCARALLEVDSQQLRLHFFANQLLPRLQVFGDYLLSGAASEFGDALEVADDFNSWTLGMRFEFPLPNRTARGDYHASRLRKERALWQWQSVRERIVREVSDALVDLQTARDRIKTARDALELARKVLTAEERSFQLGRSNSLDVLDAQEAVAAADRDVARALADYRIALANLYRAQGVLLEEKGVKVPQHRR